MATFTSEQQAAIDTYNRQKENAQSYGMRSQSMQKAALNQLKESWVGLNANWFFSLNTTNTTATTPTTTQTTNNQTNYTPTQTQTTQPTQSTQYNEWYWDLWNWNYWEDSDRRQQEIVNNLNEAYASNPNRFSDWSTFAQNFNYDYSGRSDKERETMKNWYEQNVGSSMDYNDVNNTDYFLSQLMWWGTLQGTWAAATAAQNRYRNLQSLSAMSPDQIASAIASGSLNPVWQDMIDLKNYSPALYAQVQSVLQWQTQVNDINAAWQGIYNWLTWTSTNSNYTKYDFTTEYIQNASVIKQYNESLYKKIEWLWWDTAAYVSIVASMLQNPLIQANKDDIEDLEGEVRKIQEQIYTIWDSARAALWSEAPEDLVSAYISNQTKQLQNQLRTAQNSLLVAQWKLDNQLSEVETLIDAINNGIELQQYNDKMALAWTPTTSTSNTTIRYSGWWSWTSTSSAPADTYNYQDDSEARLREIANNLNNLYQSNPELFKDRATFDNYFKYNQRSPKQKAVLDTFFASKKWMMASTLWKARVWGVPTQQEEDNLINAIKRDLLANKVVSFDATSMKKNYWNYWVLSRWQDASHNAVQQIWWISTWNEVKSMMTHLDDALDKALLDWFWSNKTHQTELVNNLKKIWNWSSKTERQQMSDYLSQFWLDEASWRKFLSDAWVKESNITKIINL